MSLSLNYFLRITATASTVPTVVYTAPADKAGIVLSAIATNLTNDLQTVTIAVSTANVSGSYFVTVESFPIEPDDIDVLNVIVGKAVLNTNDQFIIQASSNSAVNFTLSILETANGNITQEL
jgi:hypothetical protein